MGQNLCPNGNNDGNPYYTTLIGYDILSSLTTGFPRAAHHYGINQFPLLTSTSNAQNSFVLGHNMFINTTDSSVYAPTSLIAIGHNIGNLDSNDNNYTSSNGFSSTTYIGHGIKPSATPGSGINTIIIGCNAKGQSSGTSNIVFGDNNITNFYFQGTLLNISDERDKTDISNFTLGMNFLNYLNPIVYTWEPRDQSSTKKGINGIGFTAQNMQSACNAFSEYADYFDLVENSDIDELKTNQVNLVPFLINAIKEIYNINTQIETILLNNHGITVNYD
jgi:hypothetical protein